MLRKSGNANAVDLADLFCREARLRIRAHFDNLFGVNDAALYRVSQQVLKGEFEWLERGSSMRRCRSRAGWRGRRNRQSAGAGDRVRQWAPAG